MDSLTRDQQRTVYDLYYNAGRNLIRTNPQMYGDIVVRPVDRRENYVKRCVGLPGDTLQIKDTQVYIDGKAIENPEDMQLNYFVQTTGPYIPENMFRELGISNDDQILMTDDFNYEEGLMQMGLDRRDAQGRLTPVYHLPLTKKMYNTLIGNKSSSAVSSWNRKTCQDRCIRKISTPSGRETTTVLYGYRKRRYRYLDQRQFTDLRTLYRCL